MTKVEEKYTKEYLKELDEKHEMVPLYFDYLFKAVMKKNIGIFRRFLIMTLKLDEDRERSRLEFLDKEFLKEMKKEKGKTVDINVKINGKYVIDVEMNARNFNDVKLRNNTYLDKMTTNLLETGEDYEKLEDKIIYQLNLNLKDDYKNCGENIIVSYDITSKSIYIDNKKIYLKHLAYYRNLYYNNYRDLSFDEMLMVAMTCEKFTELNEVLSHILTTKEKNRFLESVINMSLDEFCLHEWEKEKLDAMVDRISKKNAFYEGLSQGKEDNTKDMIKSMLKKNISYEDISDITNKTMEEIKEIEKSMEVEE